MKKGFNYKCKTCQTEFYREPWQIKKYGHDKQKFCSLACRRHTEEGKKNVSLAKIGSIPWNKGTIGIMKPNKTSFKGEGKSTINELLRKCQSYKTWRKNVFERDNYTCQICQQRGGKLNADHIKPFAYFPDLRFELSNGRTLCVDCHRKTETFGRGATTYFGNSSLNYTA